MQSMPSPRKRPSLKVRLGLLLLPFLGFAVLEAGLRVAAPEPSWDYSVPVLAGMVADVNQIQGDLHAALDENSLLRSGYDPYTVDRRLFWRLKPGYEADLYNFLSPLVMDPELRRRGLYERARFHVSVNRLGFNGPVFSPRKPEGTFRIACIGDSNTFGWGVDPGENYPAVLGRLLEARVPGRKIEVLNLGVPGYSSLQGRVFVEEMVRDLAPDLVIAAYGFNDRWLVSRTDAEELARAESLAGRALYLFGRSRVLLWCRVLANRIAGRGKKDGEAPAPAVLTEEEIAARKAKLKRRVSPEEHGRNLEAICDLLRESGSRVLFLDLFCMGPWEEAMHRAARAEKVRVLDGEGFLLGLLERAKAGEPGLEDLRQWAREQYTSFALEKEPRLYLFNDNCHANAEGYRRLAGFVADAMVERFFGGETGGAAVPGSKREER